MAMVYDQNARKASAIYGITTLLCVITMPLMIALYQSDGLKGLGKEKGRLKHPEQGFQRPFVVIPIMTGGYIVD